MSRHGEVTLFQLLTEDDSIEILVQKKFSSELIPTPELRPIYEWAVRQYEQHPHGLAPTFAMFMETELPGHGGKPMGAVLHEYHIPLDYVPNESVEWVIEDLRSQHLRSNIGDILKACVFGVTEVPADEILEPIDALIAGTTKLRENYTSGPEAESMRSYEK